MFKISKPIIWIVAKHLSSNELRPITYIWDEYKDAVYFNWWLVLPILPTDNDIKFSNWDNYSNYLNTNDYNNLIEIIKLCDGILLQWWEKTDLYEIIIAKYAFDNNIPILWICAGQNNLVRAIWGTNKDVSNKSFHNQYWIDYVHDVNIDKNSNFYKIVKTEKIRVNSRHNKTIDDPSSYKIVWTCNDWYADIIEHPEKKFNVWVRFHPESLFRNDETQNLIFEHFINACKKCP